MRLMTLIASAAIVALSACSDKPEPIVLADEGTAPQADLARLDSAAAEELAADTMTEADTLAAVTPEEEQPRAAARAEPRRPDPRPAEVATSEAEPEVVAEPEVAAEPEPEPEVMAEPEVTSAEPEPAPIADSTGMATQPEPSSPDRDDSAAAEPAPVEAPSPKPAETAAAAPARPAPVRPSNGAGVVAAGTQVHAALNDSLDSRRDSAGKVITARVMQHVTDGVGKVFIPAGAVVQLTVTRLEPAKSRSAADGKLAIRVDGVRMGGELRKIPAEVQGGVPHELRGRGVTGSEAAKVGAGTAAGAVAGRVIGGNKKGTVIGAVAGAAAGAAVAAQTADRDVVVRARTPIVLVLRAPLIASDGR